MSDPNKFINTYIDTTIATLHEYVGSSLQLKTQLKLANDLLVERDNTISQLTSDIENIRNTHTSNETDVEKVKSELFSCNDKLKIAQDSHTALSSKLSHMDTLMKQLTDMKTEIKTKDDQIVEMTNQISSIKTELDIKNKLVEEMTEKLKILTPKSKVVEKNVKESSTANAVKVQLNTKSKKEPDDDF